MSSPQTHLVPVTLPGRGDTFLDQLMVPKIRDFISEAHQRGVDISFNSAYRAPEQQERLHRDPTAITPATHSLHSAGFAVDVEGFMRMSVHHQKVVREAAEAAGLKWGGGFRHSDPVHFYADPPVDRSTAIANATIQHHEYQRQHDHLTHSQADALREQAKPNLPARVYHAIEQGAHGAAVQSLQADLAHLGYTDHRGQPLAADGVYGIVTRHAVERFQHDHHLTVDGKVGPLTQRTLHAALQGRAVAPSLGDASHPDHALFKQSLTSVRALDAQHGRPTDQHSLNLAAALAVEAKREGLTRIDQAVPGEDGNRIFAVQNPISLWDLPKYASIETMIAMQTPAAQSNELAEATKSPPVPSASADASPASRIHAINL